MNVFIRAMVRIFSFGENGMFQSTRLRLVDWNTPFLPHENIFTIALINIHHSSIILCLPVRNIIPRLD